MKNDLIIDAFGNKYWYKNDLLHRDNDLPAIEYINGDKIWIENGIYTRNNGPAIIWRNGSNFWYHLNDLHRLDGPAVSYDNGKQEWWYKGKYINCSSQKEFIKIIKLRIFW